MSFLKVSVSTCLRIECSYYTVIGDLEGQLILHEYIDTEQSLFIFSFCLSFVFLWGCFFFLVCFLVCLDFIS